jgi:superfamily II DNA or RNA helicase
MPLYKSGVWDGTIHLINIHKARTYAGLLPDLEKFCQNRDYDFNYFNDDRYEPISKEDCFQYVNSLNLHSRSKPLEVRDYQYAAIYSALNHRRQTIISPTASGKSLIIYALIRRLISRENVLLIVPTKSLVVQMYKDFQDYSSENGFDVKENTHIIMGGHEKHTDKPITISTWQSIYKQPLSWFNKYGAVIVDECHTVQAKALTSILEKMINTPWRFGFTGSLSNSATHEMMIKAVLGPVTKVATTKELIDGGHLANIKIKAVSLLYPDDLKKEVKKMNYQKEIDFLCGHEPRNKFIRNLALSLKGNTLVLFTRVENHGEILYKMISAKRADNVHYVHGGTDVTDRDDVRHIAEASNDAIIIASVGTFSTGINIKRLNNIVFASPTKSVIRVLQSIGRGLRKADDKEFFTLYDIADDLGWKTKINYTYQHFGERLKIYTSENLPYTITEVPLVN